MKTSKEMQLKILDKMRENVEEGKELFNAIQFFGAAKWLNMEELCTDDFIDYEIRLKPETITINGVDIPEPLSKEELGNIGYCNIYYPMPIKSLFYSGSTAAAFDNYFDGMICYVSKEEAIEASKALFGIEG